MSYLIRMLDYRRVCRLGLHIWIRGLTVVGSTVLKFAFVSWPDNSYSYGNILHRSITFT